jgi:hypothetical protein
LTEGTGTEVTKGTGTEDTERTGAEVTEGADLYKEKRRNGDNMVTVLTRHASQMRAG